MTFTIALDTNDLLVRFLYKIPNIKKVLTLNLKLYTCVVVIINQLALSISNELIKLNHLKANIPILTFWKILTRHYARQRRQILLYTILFHAFSLTIAFSPFLGVASVAINETYPIPVSKILCSIIWIIIPMIHLTSALSSS